MKNADTMAAQDITALLNRSAQDPQAASAVYELVYQDLRRIAGAQARSSRRDATLSATALINEAYLKMLRRTGEQWADRKHFFRVAARAMRQITIDHTRTAQRQKRGGTQPNLSLDEARTAADRKSDFILALDEGLEELYRHQPRWVEVVELRFFAGLTGQEVAEALEISLSSVDRDWKAARAWLRTYISGDSPER